MKNRESSFGVLFRHWILANPPKLSGTYEIKQTTTNSIPFSCLEDHQADFSLAIKWSKKGVLIRNESGTVGAPDYSYYNNAPAYIVIYFKEAHGFVIIDIETFLEEKKRSQRKSLTWDRSQAIAYQTVKLK